MKMDLTQGRFRLFLKMDWPDNHVSGAVRAWTISESAGKDFLNAGFVYVSCGCRGRSSENIDKKRCGKSPLSLVDLKAGIRFLRHFCGCESWRYGKNNFGRD